MFNNVCMFNNFASYSYGYPLYTTLVLPSSVESAGTCGYWMQPSAEGRFGYLQLVWPAGGTLGECIMDIFSCLLYSAS